MENLFKILVFLLWGLCSSANAEQRYVAFTFDDLPVATKRGLIVQKEITQKLLSKIVAERIPAIGFVNEGKLYVNGTVEPEHVQLLEMWLSAGMDLGNHTFSHLDLHRNSVMAFEDDITRGEEVTRALLEKRGKRLLYFRHPFLHTGRDLDTRDKVLAYLKARGYRVAPVTIDNSEWIFAEAYENAQLSSNAKLITAIGTAYIRYMEEKFTYYERQSKELLGYQIKQILLLHANALNADYLPQLSDMLRKRGYEFISIDEALKDKAYDLPDEFAGTGGITWLHRWAITKKVDKTFFSGEPMTPEFIMKAAEVTEE